MKRGSTLFLRTVIILIGIALSAFCIFASVIVIRNENVGHYIPIVLATILSTIPIFFGLYQAWNLLNYIDRNKAFSNLSVQAIKNIKFSALGFGAVYLLGSPYIFMIAEQDDAPGVLAIALMLIAASIVVATFAAVLERLLQNGLDLKSENDLTV